MTAYCYDDSDGVSLGGHDSFSFSCLLFRVFHLVLEYWVRVDCFFQSRLSFARPARRDTVCIHVLDLLE